MRGGGPRHLGRHARTSASRLAHTGLILRPSGQGAGDPTGHSAAHRPRRGNLEEWTLQESLAFSRAGQKDFVIEIDEDDQATRDLWGRRLWRHPAQRRA